MEKGLSLMVIQQSYGDSCQGDIHLAHKARHSTCLTCGLMALPEGRGGGEGGGGGGGGRERG